MLSTVKTQESQSYSDTDAIVFAETWGEQDASAHRLFTASEKDSTELRCMMHQKAAGITLHARYHCPNCTDPRPKFASAGAQPVAARSRLRTNSTPARSRRAAAGRHVHSSPSPCGTKAQSQTVAAAWSIRPEYLASVALRQDAVPHPRAGTGTIDT